MSSLFRYLTDSGYAKAHIRSRLADYGGYLRNPGRALCKVAAKRRFAELRRTEEFRAVRSRIAALGDLPEVRSLSQAKYLDVDRYVLLNLRRAYELGLHRRRGLDILDLGSGCGYWLWVAQLLGHKGVGLDIAEPDLYRLTFEIFGLRRLVRGIEALTPLPDFGRRFDMATAFAICFPTTPTCPGWGKKEWNFFLADLFDNQLRPGGRVVLQFNAPDLYAGFLDIPGFTFSGYDAYRVIVTR